MKRYYIDAPLGITIPVVAEAMAAFSKKHHCETVAEMNGEIYEFNSHGEMRLVSSSDGAGQRPQVSDYLPSYVIDHRQRLSSSGDELRDAGSRSAVKHAEALWQMFPDIMERGEASILVWLAQISEVTYRLSAIDEKAIGKALRSKGYVADDALLDGNHSSHVKPHDLSASVSARYLIGQALSEIESSGSLAFFEQVGKSFVERHMEQFNRQQEVDPSLQQLITQHHQSLSEQRSIFEQNQSAIYADAARQHMDRLPETLQKGWADVALWMLHADELSQHTALPWRQIVPIIKADKDFERIAQKIDERAAARSHLGRERYRIGEFQDIAEWVVVNTTEKASGYFTSPSPWRDMKLPMATSLDDYYTVDDPRSVLQQSVYCSGAERLSSELLMANYVTVLEERLLENEALISDPVALMEWLDEYATALNYGVGSSANHKIIANALDRAGYHTKKPGDYDPSWDHEPSKMAHWLVSYAGNLMRRGDVLPLYSTPEQLSILCSPASGVTFDYWHGLHQHHQKLPELLEKADPVAVAEWLQEFKTMTWRDYGSGALTDRHAVAAMLRESGILPEHQLYNQKWDQQPHHMARWLLGEAVQAMETGQFDSFRFSSPISGISLNQAITQAEQSRSDQQLIITLEAEVGQQTDTGKVA